jgi:CheY-like chemotaxis protein
MRVVDGIVRSTIRRTYSVIISTLVLWTVAKPTKILLVEHRQSLRVATEQTLCRVGYEVSAVSDGGQALRSARESVPDLMLFDIVQAGLSGTAALEALKGDPVTANIPVILVTGVSMPRLFRKDLGSVDKPQLDSEEGVPGLLNTITEIVGRIRSSSGKEEKQMRWAGGATEEPG